MYYDNDKLKDYIPIMKLKHETCIYKVDTIVLDNASKDLYHLFLHCDYCGKTIKLCVRTPNNIINWLGGAENVKQ